MNKKEIENLLVERGLSNIPCPLGEAFFQIIPESIQMAHEIQRDRIQNKDDKILINNRFIVGNGCVYNVENDKAVIYFTDTQHNPILREENIEDALLQISRSGNYRVTPTDFSLIQEEAAKENGNVLRFVLSELRSVALNEEFEYFKIYPAEFGLNSEYQKSVAELVHGKGDQFNEICRMSSKEKMTLSPAIRDRCRKKIYFLSRRYFFSNSQYCPLARIGTLDEYTPGCSFWACNRIAGNANTYIRGIQRRF